VASVNFVTCHDGFTLADLVSYNTKHNEANGEGNRDGTDDNRSWNCGTEGPADDPGILALRERQACNFLATLLLSQGVPMLTAGDEMGRSQRGNNNAYCQDNEISWVHWPPAAPGEGTPGVLGPGTAEVLLDFTGRLIRLRRDHPALRRRRYLQGGPVRGADDQPGDVAWFTPGGEEMTEQDWDAGLGQSLTVFLNGGAITEADRRGQPIRDDSFVLLFNAGATEVKFALPPARYGEPWEKVLDTAVPAQRPEGPVTVKAGGLVPVRDRSLQVFRRD
jgi:glycogen operon protein